MNNLRTSFITRDITLLDGSFLPEDTEISVAYKILEGERGERGQYGEQLEPDTEDTIEITSAIVVFEDGSDKYKDDVLEYIPCNLEAEIIAQIFDELD